MEHAVQTTSLFAYEEVKRRKNPSLGDRQRAVFEELRQHEDLTNGELAAALNWPINTVTPRCKELREQGRVVEACRRPCRVTGRTCIAWRTLKTSVTPYDA
jgi:DNA-binding MarR family transcriptional regulator